MKILSLLIIISAFFSTCREEKNHTLATTQFQKEPYTNENLEKQENSIIILSHISNFGIKKLQNILINDFFEMQVDAEVKVYFESSEFCIYSVDILNDNLPNALKNKYVVIDLKDIKTQYIIDLEINQFFKINNEVMFGGFYNYREYDYYRIYNIKNTKIISKLDTRNIEKKSIIVGYYKDDECIDYLPDRLNFRFDITRKEILFEGIIDNYCKLGADRFENSSLQKRIESIIYFKYSDSEWIYDQKKSNYFFW